MKKEIADRWIEALESGKYSQTTNNLKTSEGFCCLGVLCEITKEETGLEWTDWDKSSSSICGHTVSLPGEVQDIAGMHTSCGVLPLHLFRGKSLTSLNDDGKTFSEIAQIIRDNWEEL